MKQSESAIFPLKLVGFINEKPRAFMRFVDSHDKVHIATVRARQFMENGQPGVMYQLYDRRGKIVVSEKSIQHMLNNHLRRNAAELHKVALEVDLEKASQKEMEQAQAQVDTTLDIEEQKKVEQLKSTQQKKAKSNAIEKGR